VHDCSGPHSRVGKSQTFCDSSEASYALIERLSHECLVGASLPLLILEKTSSPLPESPLEIFMSSWSMHRSLVDPQNEGARVRFVFLGNTYHSSKLDRNKMLSRLQREQCRGEQMKELFIGLKLQAN
jgi:hypothetical protein